jgi:outer membrane protein assembly factor BamA
VKVSFKHIVFLLFLSVLAVACNPTKRIADGELLLQKNKIKIKDSPKGFGISQYDMSAVLKQRPNRRVLLFRFHLGVYNKVNPERRERSHERKVNRVSERIVKKELKLQDRIEAGKSESSINRLTERIKEMKSEPVSTIRDWLTTTVGEKPVVFDSVLTRKSANQLSVFLSKRGYFNNVVSTDIDTIGKGKRAVVTYTVIPSTPYVIASLDYDITDPGLARRRDFFKDNTKVVIGEHFEVQKLDKEREWVTSYLNDRGYYGFTKEYISFSVDSTNSNGTVDVVMRIKNRKAQSPEHPDSLIELAHKKYFMGRIYVHTNYNSTNINYQPQDTLDYAGLSILYTDKMDLDPDLIRFLVMFSQGDLYQKTNITNTYRNFGKLQLYRSATVRFDNNPFDELNVLDCHLLLTKAKKHSLAMESTGTHKNGNLGVQGNLSYQHRNVFGGAENGQINLLVGFEAQNTITETQTSQELNGSTVADRARLNTFEIGPEFSLKIHKLVPFAFDKFSRNSEPSTTITASYNFQSRPDYERQLSRLKFGYDWVENKNKGSKIYWDLWQFSLIKIDKSPAFNQLLDDLGDAYLASSYNDHLISSGAVSWVINSQKSNRQRKYHYNRASFSLAGNLLRAGFSLAGANEKGGGGYEIGGIQFAQFVKFEEDFRIYRQPDEKNVIAFRFNTGIGKPGANLSALPFEESFFAGGSNGIRAWQARSLGPGSYRDPSSNVTYNSIGEFKIETSLEYRFDITPMFEGAMFFDAGNIWLLQQDETRPGGRFELKNLAREMAVGGGVGLRLDFDFFLVRFDYGVQLKDPAKIAGEQWFFQPKVEYLDFSNRSRYRPRSNFNLGIGYPF